MSTAPPELPLHRATVPFYHYYILFTLATAAPVGALLVLILTVIPSFREIFKDFKTELPTLTIYALEFSSWLQSGFWLLLLPAIFFLALLPARLTAGQKTTHGGILIALYYMLSLGIVSLTTLAILTTALLAPLIKLIHSVSGGAP